MAYNPLDLSALAYNNGFTLWHYRTEDTPGRLNAVGYFNQSANILCTGDFICVNARTHAGEPYAAWLFVVRNQGGEVETRPMAQAWEPGAITAQELYQEAAVA